MAEVMEGTCKHEYASKAKANAGLTTGIIGTSLAGLLTLGAMNNGNGLLGGILGGKPECQGVPHGELYNERKEQADFVELTNSTMSHKSQQTRRLTRIFSIFTR